MMLRARSCASVYQPLLSTLCRRLNLDLLQTAHHHEQHCTGATWPGSTAVAAVDTVSEKLLISSPSKAKVGTSVSLLERDHFFGRVFDKFMLEAVFFYEAPLDADKIRCSLCSFMDVYPELAGRLSPSGDAILLCNSGMRFSACANYPGSAKDFCGAQARGGYDNLEGESRRNELFVDRQIDVGAGEPLLTIRVTNFGDGTSAFGISMPHTIVDGKSFFLLLKALSSGHLSGSFGSPELSFDRQFLKKSFPKLDSNQLSVLSKPRAFPIRGGPFNIIGKCLEFLMDKYGSKEYKEQNFPRAKIHVTKAELDAMQAGLAGKLDDGATPTKAEALAAHIAQVCLQASHCL